MKNQFQISVVIPVKNQEKKIGNCLDAIQRQTIKPYEIIIVDGHSTDKTIAICEKYPVKIIFEDYGTIGGARQVGLEKSCGDIIAYTDSDCIPEIVWLENLIKGFSTDVVGVGGGIRNIANGLWEESISLALDSFLGSAYSVQDRVFDDRRYVKSISGCNSCYRRADLLKVGGFRTYTSLNEDTEINQRLMAFGKLLYVPDAIVLHDQDRNLGKFSKRIYMFGYGRGVNRLFDLQCIPPVIALLVALLPLISIPAFLAMICIYIIILALFTVKITLKSKKVQHLVSVPIVYMIEHLSYTIGFYIGLLNGILHRQKNTG